MKAKIAIALVSHDQVPVTFAYDLANLAAFSAYHIPEDKADLGINLISGTYVHSARREMLEAMLANEVTHILWIDTDMRFPKDALLRLLEHKIDVVGINYSKRELPASFVAIKSVSWDRKGESVRLQTNADSTGLEEVESMGMGMVLMRTQCLKDLPSLDDDPWFFFEWLPGRRMVGEDVYFFRLLRERGVRLFVDHDLSKQCKHIGMMEYTCEYAEMSAKLDVEIQRQEDAK